MIRVIVADDHAVVREGLKQIVAEVPDMTVVAEAATGDETLAARVGSRICPGCGVRSAPGVQVCRVCESPLE